jgi:hypothetical protein
LLVFAWIFAEVQLEVDFEHEVAETLRLRAERVEWRVLALGRNVDLSVVAG